MLKTIAGRGLTAARGILAFVLASSAAATGADAQVIAATAPIAQAAHGATVQLANGQLAAAISTPAAAIVRAPLAVASTLPLSALVAMHSAGAALDAEQNCLAVAVYHEARGESIEGQLAVANVIINRARSGKYPPTWCEVVKQPWQFSFVRAGRFPSVDQTSPAWTRAQAIARIAAGNVAAEVGPDVLWYHADYVSPSWGRRLTRAEKIGTHIFYRS